MKIKITIILSCILAIVLLALFGTSIKDKAKSEILSDVGEYSCNNGICSSCIIEGNLCYCNEEVCKCGDKTVVKSECNLINIG